MDCCNQQKDESGVYSVYLGAVSEAGFTVSFGTVLRTVNTRHLKLRISVNCKLTRIRNNGLLQTTDRWYWCLFSMFQCWFQICSQRRSKVG